MRNLQIVQSIAYYIANVRYIDRDGLMNNKNNFVDRWLFSWLEFAEQEIHMFQIQETIFSKYGCKGWYTQFCDFTIQQS